MSEKDAPLAPNIRVLIGIVSFPALFAMGVVVYMMYNRMWSDISWGSLVFSGVGILIYYIVFTGRIPKFLRFRRQSQ